MTGTNWSAGSPGSGRLAVGLAAPEYAGQAVLAGELVGEVLPGDSGGPCDVDYLTSEHGSSPTPTVRH